MFISVSGTVKTPRNTGEQKTVKILALWWEAKRNKQKLKTKICISEFRGNTVGQFWFLIREKDLTQTNLAQYYYI